MILEPTPNADLFLVNEWVRRSRWTLSTSGFTTGDPKEQLLVFETTLHGIQYRQTISAEELARAWNDHIRKATHANTAS
jgi:hypothetical protein